MSIMIIMKSLSIADLVWVATASLSREQPGRSGFSSNDIRQKVYEIEPDHGFSDSGIRTHISSHCVANKKPDPGKHRKLYLNPDETYRLYRPGDDCHSDRNNGKTLPKAEQIPPKYRDLLDWYTAAQDSAKSKPGKDPLLALRGLGKEVWKDLGGGENFIRELREHWYGERNDADFRQAARKEKRAS